MKTKHLLKMYVLIALSMLTISCSTDDDNAEDLAQWEIEVNELKAASAKYMDVQVATDEGFIDVSGFVPNMGHHYLLPSRVDDIVKLDEPELVLYAPDTNGTMQMVAVEFAVPVEDLENPGAPPEGFTGNLDVWHLNTNLSQWQLHVWIVRENPDGIFAEFNPAVGTE